jgi:hypothetical protein
MASRKEEKERLRRQREQADAAARKQERKRLILGYAVAGLISLAVVVGIAFAIVGGSDSDGGGDGDGGDRLNETFGAKPQNVNVDTRTAAAAPSDGDTADLDAAAKAAGCELLREQKDEGSTHIPESDEQPDYEANPATSGDHVETPLADGAFDATPSPLNYIHALEHGRIQVQYNSDLPEGDQRQLLGLYDEDPAGMILFPNDDMPYLVAATAWRQTLGCETYEGGATLDAIRAFRSEFRARGPEPIAMQ